jgi:hydrogenase maturation protease
VLFDFDYSLALNKIKDRIGVPAEKIIHDLFYNRFADDFEKGLISSYDFYLKFKQEFRVSIEYEEFIEVWCDIFTPKYEVIDLVDRLRIIYPVYLISNINELHFDFLHKKYPHVFSLFDGLILSFKTKSLKPEEEIYVELKRVSAKNYESIVYIDDREDLLNEAKELNLDCIRFTNLNQLKTELAARPLVIADDYEKTTLMHLKNTINAYKKPLLVGMGNSLRSDDAVGIKIAAAVKDNVSLKIISVEASLENYLGLLKKENADLFIFIDAADLEGDKSFAYFLPQDVQNIPLFFTHDSSLKLAFDYLHSNAVFDILILAIKGYNYSLGGQIAPGVNRTEKLLTNFFLRNFGLNRQK